MKIRIISKPDPLYLCYSALFPKTLIKKAFGLTFLNNFKNFDGILFKNCRIIHSIFMKFSFDVLFLDAEYKVIALHSGFKPFRISKYFKKAKYVLELPEGTIKKFNIGVFDKLEVNDL